MRSASSTGIRICGEFWTVTNFGRIRAFLGRLFLHPTRATRVPANLAEVVVVEGEEQEGAYSQTLVAAIRARRRNRVRSCSGSRVLPSLYSGLFSKSTGRIAGRDRGTLWDDVEAFEPEIPIYRAPVLSFFPVHRGIIDLGGKALLRLACTSESRVGEVRASRNGNGFSHREPRKSHGWRLQLSRSRVP